MVVFRRVMQVLWLVVIAVVAVALVKIAFFPDGGTSSDPTEPGAEIVEPHWEVARGTVATDVTLSGMIAADEAIPIPATASGTVWNVYVSPGQWVDVGTPVVRIRSEQIAWDGSSSPTLVTVTSPAAGTLSSFPTFEGSSASAGAALGQIAPPSFHVTGTIPPEELYRLIEQPTEATVTVNGGPAPFTCTGLRIITPLPGQEGSNGGSTATTPSVRCAVPGDVRVFAGLTAEIVIPGGIAEDVVVVPTTAVLGQAGTGIVFVVAQDGSTEEREVTLGLNDGSMVEVTSGLEVGETILQFVPGAPSAPGDLPVDGMVCRAVPGGEECFAP